MAAAFLGASEYLIRGEDDFARHVDYIHWNLVKLDGYSVWRIGPIQAFTPLYDAVSMQ